MDGSIMLTTFVTGGAVVKSIVQVFLLLGLVGFITGCCSCLGPDREPPAMPRGVFSVTGDEKVTLYWTSNTERDLEGYCVYRSQTPYGYFELIATTVSAYYVDYDVINGETYYYAVSAVDRHGNESDLSEDMVFDTPRPEGRAVVLWDSEDRPYEAGFDFSEVMVQDDSLPSTDVYLDYDEGDDLHFMVTANAYTDIQDFGTIDDLDEINWAPGEGWSNIGAVELILHHGYIVWTCDDHFAKFWVTGLGLSWVRFDWAYQVDPGNPELVAQGP
jgi:hypothetical protein